MPSRLPSIHKRPAHCIALLLPPDWRDRGQQRTYTDVMAGAVRSALRTGPRVSRAKPDGLNARSPTDARCGSLRLDNPGCHVYVMCGRSSTPQTRRPQQKPAPVRWSGRRNGVQVIIVITLRERPQGEALRLIIMIHVTQQRPCSRRGARDEEGTLRYRAGARRTRDSRTSSCKAQPLDGQSILRPG